MNDNKKISAGEIARTMIIAGEQILIESGGTAFCPVILNGGKLTVERGGTALNAKIENEGRLDVEDGGSAISTVICDYGECCVASGGTAIDTTVYHGYAGAAKLHVGNGGVALNTVLSGGALDVHSGGTAVGVMMECQNNRAPVGPMPPHLTVSGGGSATDIRTESFFEYEITLSPDTLVQGTSNGSIFEIIDGFASDFEVKCGSLILASGGTAVNPRVLTRGRLTIQSGGVTVAPVVKSNGFLFVCGGGAAAGIQAEEGASLIFQTQSGVLIQGTCNGNAFEYGEMLSGFEIFSGITLAITSGASAVGAVIKKDGTLEVLSGGTAVDVTIQSGGTLTVNKGGTAVSAAIQSGGLLERTLSIDLRRKKDLNKPRAVWRSPVVCSGVELTVEKDVTAISPFVRSGAKLTVNSGGSALDVVKEVGAEISLEDGAVVTYFTPAEDKEIKP